MKGSMKRVVNRIDTSNKYNRPFEGKTEHVLECGHSRIEKTSYGRPRRMHCRECESQVKSAP